MDLEATQVERRASGATSYPFLNHSHATLTNDLPPDVDDKPLARQRRKRTSPEDQAILEAAYQTDPKPDKAARLRLVEQIALGEKEVQIWFQNRRQTSRRKSRPLLPHEIAQFQMARYGSTTLELSSDSHADSNDSSYHNDPRETSEWLKQSQCKTDEEPASTSSQDEPSSDDSAPSAERDDQPAVTRRSMPSLQQILSEPQATSNGNKHPLSFTGRPLKKATSFVRISTTAGKAQVVTKDGFTPSPPRQDQVLLDNSLSDKSTPALKSESSFISSLKRSSSGRSRDSRAWEFWCDKECRTELEHKAEKDGNGSAADAIDAIRSTGQRKALQPLPSKHSLFSNRQSLLPPRRLVDGKRPALQRAHTSNGRLQHADTRTQAYNGKRARLSKPTVLDTDSSTYIPGNESDKENWSPEHSSNALTTKKSESGFVVTTKGKTHDRRLVRSQSMKAGDAENVDPEADEELASFMHGGRSSSSLSGAEELDCVHGLLSLSQGRWVS